MARTVEGTLQQAVAKEYQTLLHRVARSAAGEVGDIPGGEKLSPADEDARWSFTVPDVTPEQYPQVAAAITDGLVKQIQGAGQTLPDPETMTRLVASQMTRVLTKGYRRELVSRSFPMPQEQVKRAEALRKRNEQAQSETAETPEPAEPMPDAEPTMAATVQEPAAAPSAPKYDYSSTQLDLPEPLAGRVLALGQAIPDTDLAEDGREDDPHVTVKYGLETGNADDVRPIVAQHGPITITLGKTSLFPANKQDGGKPGDFDVVKIDVVSPELRVLNAELSKLPNGDTHPTYTPHATIAYVKPGMGEKYAGRADLEGQQATIGSLTFSGKDGERVMLPLGQGAPPQEPAAAQGEQPAAVRALAGQGGY